MAEADHVPFRFTWGKNGSNVVVEEEIEIPIIEDVEDLIVRLATTRRIPVYVKEDLDAAVRQFVAVETEKYHNAAGDEAIQELLFKDDDEANEMIESVSQSWGEHFSNTRKEYACRRPVEDSHVLSDVFHSLIRSNQKFLSQILEKEKRFAVEMQKLVQKRDAELAALGSGPSLESTPQSPGQLTDGEINRRTAAHFESLQVLENEHNSKISSLAESQRAEYRNFVMKLSEQMVLQRGSPVKMDRALTLTEDTDLYLSEAKKRARPGMEESFTIHLGAQLKSMHNIQLSAVKHDSLYLHKEESYYNKSLRLQMALALYEERLNGVVLLVPPRLRHHISLTTAFAKACEQTTELHFPSLSQQLDDIESDVGSANDHRFARAVSLFQSQRLAGEAQSGDEPKMLEGLQTGDVYLTRHSNLAQIHMAFHLVQDTALPIAEINSRHPCIAGLRNVVRMCVKYGVTKISIPLLLIHDMTEEITIPWCVKRAELVYKCVKGFLIESLPMSRAGNTESRMDQQQFTVQFLVPPQVSQELFAQLSEMLTQIFQTYGPVKV